MSSSNFPWYEIVEKAHKLSQGEIIKNLPIIIPPKDDIIINSEYEIEVRTFDVIIMSQSCDLEHGKLSSIVVSAIFDLDLLVNQLTKSSNKKDQNKIKNDIRMGNRPSYHLLDECALQDNNFNYKVVSFRDIYTIDVDFLNDFVNKQGIRIRLLSPYREHLSQSFARFFMRVGLPSNISEFR